MSYFASGDRFRWPGRLALAAWLAFGPLAWAQPTGPRLGYLYPAGGQQGATLQVKVGGQSLDGVTNVYVSGAGVQATVVDYVKPLTQQQVNQLREELQELQSQRGAGGQNRNGPPGPRDAQSLTNRVRRMQGTSRDVKRIAEIRKALANRQKLITNPALAEIATLQVALAPGAAPGERELRLGTALGLSNPLIFCVGQLPELRDNDLPGAPEAGPSLTLPVLVNGQILPGEVDRFRFRALRGQSLVAVVSARELIPYLADAVPGWFQAALTLYDEKGHELAHAGHYFFHPDPVLHYEIPHDGFYTLAIHDAIYRGREDFVYRLAVGELPFITSLFPLGGPAGVPTPVAIQGWNLPVTSLTPDVKDSGPGIQSLWVRQGERRSNRMPFAVDTLPESRETEPNSPLASAQAVTLPRIVNGRIDPPGDADSFCFQGRAGETVVAEIQARRLNSPLDSVLKLTDASGRPLAFNDDHEDKGAGRLTHHADSWLSVSLPADGTYYLHLSDAQRQGGVAYAYRLRLSPPRPDFELRITPSSIGARPGTTVPLTVYALRQDGFTNEIVLGLKDAPSGFSLSGGRVPAGQDQVRLTLTVPALALEEPISLSLEGRARIAGREIAHPGVPADDLMQAFAYRHLVPAQDLKVAVTGRGMFRPLLRILGGNPVRIPAGGTAQVRIAGPANAMANRVQLELSEPPEGITLQKVVSAGNGLELVLHSDAAKVKPGLQGNLIVSVLAANLPAGPGRAPPGNQRRRPQTLLPAIPFEIVAADRPVRAPGRPTAK